MSRQCRNICFTVNNYSDEEREHILNWDKWAYVIVAEEIGETGTSHLQCYGELTNRVRFGALQDFFERRAHIEERRGTQKEAIDYCKKDGVFEERGQKRNQGNRGDLERVRHLALDLGMRGVTRVCNSQQIKVSEKFLQYNEEERDWKPQVIWLWGKTGVGKSRKAREILNDDIYTKNEGSKWWDGYDGHENVIIDDFRGHWFSDCGGFNYILGLLDRYGFMVQYKGGHRQFLARRIVITCPWPPEQAIQGGVEDIQQILRRIDVIELMDEPEVWPETEVVGGNTMPPRLPDNIENNNNEIEKALDTLGL
nr:rep protein [Cressdnaviricota sp.]